MVLRSNKFFPLYQKDMLTISRPERGTNYVQRFYFEDLFSSNNMIILSNFLSIPDSEEVWDVLGVVFINSLLIKSVNDITPSMIKLKIMINVIISIMTSYIFLIIPLCNGEKSNFKEKSYLDKESTYLTITFIDIKCFIIKQIEFLCYNHIIQK